MGDRDWVKPLLEAKGTIHFGRVLMKPGKPLTFATLELPHGRQMLVFGLPGGHMWRVACASICPCTYMKLRSPAKALLHTRPHMQLNLCMLIQNC